MKPVKHEFCNTNLTPNNDPACTEDLPVWTDGTQTISCWDLSDEELALIKETGQIWIAIRAGATQHPMAVSVEPMLIRDGMVG